MNRVKIIYVYDPMCGWCYGFSPVIKALEEKYKHLYDFEILSGGMVIGDREGPIGDFADYILSAYKRVEETTGVKFGKAYLDLLVKKEYYSSSFKPSVALSIIKAKYPDLAIRFAHDMQKAFYFDGKLLQDDSTYIDILSKLNIVDTSFISDLNKQDYISQTRAEFEFVSKIGISGFPALIAEKDSKYYLIASGYKTLSEIEKLIAKIE